MNKLNITVLSALALFGVAFPVSVALANRPEKVEIPAVIGDAQIGPVTVVEELPGTSEVVLDEVNLTASAPTHAAKKTQKAQHVQSCRGYTLEQQGRPDHQMVRICE
ncbi:MAG TPA: hypothetical protein VIE65_04165 [Methylobacter sp.]|jgi:hypothetical protein